jgi:hypothetical protein
MSKTRRSHGMNGRKCDFTYSYGIFANCILEEKNNNQIIDLNKFRRKKSSI